MKKTEVIMDERNRKEAEEIYGIMHGMKPEEKEKFLFFMQGYKQGYSSAKEPEKEVSQSA